MSRVGSVCLAVVCVFLFSLGLWSSPVCLSSCVVCPFWVVLSRGLGDWVLDGSSVNGGCVVATVHEPGWIWGFSLVCRGEGACR